MSIVILFNSLPTHCVDYKLGQNESSCFVCFFLKYVLCTLCGCNVIVSHSLALPFSLQSLRANSSLSDEGLKR